MILALEQCIREMQIGDYNEFNELWSRTPGMGLSSVDTYDSIEKFLLKNKELSFICKGADKIVGTILCGHDGRRGYIYHVAVDMEYRGKGIGRALVEKSLKRLKEERIDKCHLFVFADNELGNTFWSSTGWIKREDIFVYSKSI